MIRSLDVPQISEAHHGFNGFNLGIKKLVDMAESDEEWSWTVMLVVSSLLIVFSSAPETMHFFDVSVPPRGV